MARRIAGSEGSGGPPARCRCPTFSPPDGSLDLLEPQVLKEREADERHQRMVVQPGPTPPVEVVQPKLLLELLVRLLADPARLDSSGQPAERGAGPVIRQVVLVLTRCLTPLAHQPHRLLARQVLTLRDPSAVGDHHAHGGEARRERSLRPRAPAEA